MEEEGGKRRKKIKMKEKGKKISQKSRKKLKKNR